MYQGLPQNQKIQHVTRKIVSSLSQYAATDLIVGSNECLAGDTRISEQLFVALLAVRLVVSKYVSLSYKTAATASTAELTATPVLLH